MSNVCIIPARGGSKRISRKNIRDFLGKPIIAYAIEAALASRLFDEVMVSTEDAEIAALGQHFGATIPFTRSIQTSDDYATTGDVLTEVLKSYALEGRYFDYACCIYPTAAFVTKEKLSRSFELLKTNNFSSVFPIIPFGYPIQRALRFDNAKVSMIQIENLNKRSQDLEAAYHDAGQFYWFRVSDFMETGKLFTANSGALVVDQNEAQDIDIEADWKLAELKYELLQGIK